MSRSAFDGIGDVDVLAFLAATALAKFCFSGRKLFIVLLVGIQILPLVGLIVPLDVVLSRSRWWARRAV